MLVEEEHFHDLPWGVRGESAVPRPAEPPPLPRWRPPPPPPWSPDYVPELHDPDYEPPWLLEDEETYPAKRKDAS